MTFKELERFLKTEKWRAGTRQNTDMCGKYARCVYCDRYCDYPCARAFDALVRKKREGRAALSSWQYPEPDVKEKFGTVYASEETVGSVTKISIDPEDLFFFSLGGRSIESFANAYFGKGMNAAAETAYSQTACVSLPEIDEEETAEETPASERKGRGVLFRRKSKDTDTRVLVIKKRTQY